MTEKKVEEKKVEEKVEAGEPAAESDQPKSAKKWKKILIWAASLLVALLILAFGVTAFGIYKLGWNGPAVKKIEAAIPFPIATVNGKIVSIADFDARFDAFKKAITYNQSFDFSDPNNAALVEQQKSDLLSRLVDLKLEEQLAKKYGVTYTSDELDAEMASIAEASGIADADLDNVLDTVYGWTRQDFKRYVVEPQLIEKKLQTELLSDKTLNADAYAKIQEAKDKIDAGADFAEVAKEYSEDESTKDLGGDLGWTPKGVFVKEFEDAALALSAGQVSDVIATPFGLHIMQLLGTNTDENGNETFHARHILVFGKDFSLWLTEQRDAAKIREFSVS